MRASVSPLLLCVTAFLSMAIAASAQHVVNQGSRQPAPLSKPRIAPLPEGQWTDVQQQLVAKYSIDGRADDGLKTLLHLPELVEGVMPYTIYLLDESSLSLRHRELLVLRAAWLCGSQPLWATHAARTRKAGLNADEIRRIA